MSSKAIPRRDCNYLDIVRTVQTHFPRKVLYRILDSSTKQEWILRVEVNNGMVIGQRYVKVENSPENLLKKVFDYNSIALEMMFNQLLESEDSPFSITGISLE